MTRPTLFDRRRFLAGSAAGLAASSLALPALAQQPGAGDVDIAIIGAGAAGIAAARKLAAAGRSYVLLEAAPKAGGRARTDTVFGVPFDLGANRFSRDGNSLADAADDAKVELVDVPSSRRLYIEGREARESQYEKFAAAIGRTERAIAATADAGRDIAAGAVLPDVGEWTATVAAVLGPLGCGRPLSGVSTVDFARRDAPPADTSAALGVGVLLEALAAPLNLRTGARVARIDNAGRVSVLAFDGAGSLKARAVILAVPAAVLAAGAIRFNPGLPARVTGALQSYPSGFIEQVGFLLPGNPLGLSPNELVHVKAGNAVPGALYGRIGGTDLHVAMFGAAQATEIATKGKDAGAALARAFVGAAFGAAAGLGIGQVATSRWSADPLIRGAFAVGEPRDGGLRRGFADPVGRLIFAGEYTSVDQWGTLAGAWNSGEAAADRALQIVGGPS